MTKREEIATHIDMAILGVVVNIRANPDGDYGALIQEARRLIVGYLHSQGVVIKGDDQPQGYEAVGAGTRVEPLVRE